MMLYTENREHPFVCLVFGMRVKGDGNGAIHKEEILWLRKFAGKDEIKKTSWSESNINIVINIKN
jgi:hypothetical protein